MAAGRRRSADKEDIPPRGMISLMTLSRTTRDRPCRPRRPCRPARPRRPSRPRRPVPQAVLDHARARRPDGGAFGHVRDDPRLQRAGVPRRAVGVAGARHRHVLLGRQALPHRCDQRDPFPRTGNDAADRAGHHGGVRLVVGRKPRRARPPARLLVGAGAADRDHAARPLDRDALAGADQFGAGLARRAAARRGRAGRRGSGRHGRAVRSAASATW